MVNNEWTEVKSELKEIKQDIGKIQVSTAKLDQEIDGLKHAVVDLKNDLRNDFVTEEAFTPVRSIVYGTVGLISIGFLTALLILIGWR